MRKIEELNDTIDYLKSVANKLNLDTVSISLYIKTPNIFYKTQRVYIQIDNKEVQDITKTLSESKVSEYNLRSVRNLMSILYHFYFIDNNTIFNYPYYNLRIFKTDRVWSDKISQTGCISPDPLDLNGTVIRK